MRAGQDGPLQDVFALVAETARPGWQRSAVLRGAEAALLGAAMPGGGGGGRGGLNAAGRGAGAPATPGARGGRGGTPAFPRAATPRGQASMPAVLLSREPALVGVAQSDSGDLGQRATAVLARLSWPGKANAGPAIVALTPEEQQRFAAGRELYQTLCAACHQPDGRGREHLAPALVGSELALGPADIAARIVLGGKEGSTGLMPPLGAALSDEPDRRGAHLHPPRVGPRCVACRPFDGEGGPRSVDRPNRDPGRMKSSRWRARRNSEC